MLNGECKTIDTGPVVSGASSRLVPLNSPVGQMCQPEPEISSATMCGSNAYIPIIYIFVLKGGLQ